MNDRTMIAATCLSGMLANPSLVSEFGSTARPSDAVKYADALLKELGAVPGDEYVRGLDATGNQICNKALEEAAGIAEYNGQSVTAGRIRALKKSEAK